MAEYFRLISAVIQKEKERKREKKRRGINILKTEETNNIPKNQTTPIPHMLQAQPAFTYQPFRGINSKIIKSLCFLSNALVTTPSDQA